jgi:hypothetical protein
MLGAAAAALESNWIRAMVAERGSTYSEFMMPGSKTREEKFSTKASPKAVISAAGFFFSVRYYENCLHLHGCLLTSGGDLIQIALLS